jgi:hypothetical protein
MESRSIGLILALGMSVGISLGVVMGNLGPDWPWE